MIRLYRLVGRVICAVVAPFGRWRTYRGDSSWRERLGNIEGTGPFDLWLHAASVGEARVVSYLAAYLRKQRPDLRLHVTVMTKTAHTLAREWLQETAEVGYVPLDCPQAVRRRLAIVRPRMIVVAETEIWPCLVTEAKRQGIPMVLVNGRMSERSLKRYRFVAGAMRRLLQAYERFFVKSDADRDRLAALGAPAERLVVTGDMKFDAPLPPRSLGRIRELRYRFGVPEEAFVWVAGSTRPGEEALVAQAYRDLAREFPHLRLVLAPRHPERANEVEAELERLGLSSVRPGGKREQVEAGAAEPAPVLLIDRMGLLNDLYLMADVAFVGGTFADIGGHNLLEPVWAGTPVLYGPSLDNVREAAEYIERHRYGRRCGDVRRLRESIRELLTGDGAFVRKTETDLQHSATAVAGDFLLERLDDT